MKHEKLSQALNEISDQHISEAAAAKKRRYPWLGPVAAVLALAILVGTAAGGLGRSSENSSLEFAQDSMSQAQALLLAAPVYPKLTAYDDSHDMDKYDAWWADQKALHDQPDGYADNLTAYFSESIPQMLCGMDGQNVSCSPVNIYMALAMLAQTTSGNSRAQLLELLNADSIDALRTQAGHVWNAHYNDDGLSTSILGSSLWLDDDYTYSEDIVNTLAQSYYASVYRGQLGTDTMNKALQTWLSENTGGLLKEAAQNAELSPISSVALATTIYYQVQWTDEFHEKFNTEGTFHRPDADENATFMNRELSWGPYYWGKDFGAICLPLEDNSRMWLILPDEGIAPEQLLESGYAMDFVMNDPESSENQKTMIVNLSVPKFDISSELDLIDALKNLGVTDLFESGVADFSEFMQAVDGIEADDGGWVSDVKHATRVAIDEKGITAAAFTVIDRAGAAMPPEEEIDFVLDRPFLFAVISRDGLPLFTGIVNDP